MMFKEVWSLVFYEFDGCKVTHHLSSWEEAIELSKVILKTGTVFRVDISLAKLIRDEKPFSEKDSE